MLRCADLVTFLGQELSANAKIDMDKDKEKLEKVTTTTHPPRSSSRVHSRITVSGTPTRCPPHRQRCTLHTTAPRGGAVYGIIHTVLGAW